MINENIRKIQLQSIYLGMSLVSFFCVMNNFYIITCSNFVGIVCFFDLYFVKSKDMMLHHILVLLIIYCMNKHNEFENRNLIVSTMLSTEISTIFLTTNNLLDITGYMVPFKKINKIMFIFTFLYYRIYNY